MGLLAVLVGPVLLTGTAGGCLALSCSDATESCDVVACCEGLHVEYLQKRTDANPAERTCVCVAY